MAPIDVFNGSKKALEYHIFSGENGEPAIIGTMSPKKRMTVKARQKVYFRQDGEADVVIGQKEGGRVNGNEVAPLEGVSGDIEGLCYLGTISCEPATSTPIDSVKDSDVTRYLPLAQLASGIAPIIASLFFNRRR